MAILDKFHRAVGGGISTARTRVTTADLPEQPVEIRGFEATEKQDEEAKSAEDAQTGVKKIEAVTLAWSKKSLAGVLSSTIVVSLTPFATSDWQSHSLLTVIGVVANSMTAAVYIPMAKLLDVWGRAEGTYMNWQVFYSVGFGGLAYSWDVLAADVTNLRNRGLAFALPPLQQ
ncbi:hypothetical protein B7463_g70, partial [Scytalidium lignicola]